MIPIDIGNERNPDVYRDSWVFFNSLIVGNNTVIVFIVNILSGNLAVKMVF